MRKKRDPRAAKWAKQRKTRGFDDRELWDLRSTIAKFVLPRLKAYAAQYSGYPPALGHKEWRRIQREMIFAFEYEAGDQMYFGKDGRWDDRRHKADRKRAMAGLQLFAKHFEALWD